METPFITTIRDFSPAAIMDSGQCFRMERCDEETIRLTAFGRRLYISGVRESCENRKSAETDSGMDSGTDSGMEHCAEGTFSFSCTETEFNQLWRGYFDLDTDYGAFRKLVPETDLYLRKAMAMGRGIRILRQEPFEMLISFIISQRKSVPAIRTAVNRLSECFGKQMRDAVTGEVYYAFPGPEALAGGTEEQLCSCGLGYRLPYVRAAAEKIAADRTFLEGLSSLPTEELLEALQEIKGVGIKVASCVALFAYHRLEVVPVDVWMKRVILIRYGGRLPDMYEPCGGVLQQYLFNYARLFGTES